MVRLKRTEWAFLALACAVGAACLRLGLWQVSRLEERRERNVLIRDRLALEPVTAMQAARLGDEVEFRPVTASGSFDPGHQIVLANRPRDGLPGVHLVTPLLLENGSAALLVDRGWLPYDQAEEEQLEELAIPGQVTVRGLARLSQPQPILGIAADRLPATGMPPLRSWRFLDIDSIQEQNPYPLLGFYLELTEPIPGHPVPYPDPQIDLSDGSHLGYAIQWFAFAAIAFMGSAGWVWQRRRRGSAG
jgi:surfeit locus 1 family protein